MKINTGILLVDLDGVVADLEGTLWRILADEHPDCPQIAPEDRNTFYVEDQIGSMWRPTVESIINRAGFFASLECFPNALEGVKKLSELFEVVICTSPVSTPHCAIEKFSWVAEHLGSKQASRMVVTKDKTLIHGDYLIDDRPEVKGMTNPTWEHILYDQPCNRSQTNRRKLTWDQVIAGTDCVTSAVTLTR